MANQKKRLLLPFGFAPLHCYRSTFEERLGQAGLGDNFTLRTLPRWG